MLPSSVWSEIVTNDLAWSIYFTSSSVIFLKLLFLAHLLIALCVLIGFKTRLMTFLLWFFTVSLFVRNSQAVHMGDYFLTWMILWGCFVPWGNQFSLDRALSRPLQQSFTTRPILSPGSFALILQGPLVYFIAGFHKIWDNSWTTALSTFQYSINPQLQTWVGFLVREHTPELFLKVFTAIGLGTELIVPILIFLPLGILGYKQLFEWLRTGIFFYLIIFQLMLEAVVDVGFFPYISIISLIPIIPARLWNGLNNKLDKMRDDITIYIGLESPVSRLFLSVYVEFLCPSRIDLEKLEKVPDQGSPTEAPRWLLEYDNKTLSGHKAISKLLTLCPLLNWFEKETLDWLAIKAQKVAAYLHSKKPWTNLIQSIGYPGLDQSTGIIGNFICIVLIIWSTFLIAESLTSKTILTSVQKQISNTFFLKQDFDIFTRPLEEVSRISVVGTLLESKSGKQQKKQYVFSQGGQPATRRDDLRQPQLEKILYGREHYVSVFEHHRWRLYKFSASTVKHRKAYLKYVCWTWNRNHLTGPYLWNVKYYSLLESEDFLKSYRKEPEIKEIYKYNCFNETFEILKSYQK